MAFDPFRYDPFSSAAPARRPAPAQRLSYDELLASLQQQFQPAPRPAAARSVQELDPEARRGVRQESIIAALASLGASMQTNDWRYAGAGAGQVADIGRAGVADANARAESAWQRQQEDAAASYQQEAKAREVAALHGMYERAIEGEDPGGAFASRAETAARAGSMSELAQLAAPETKQKRAFIRSKGMDPDAWDANQRAEAELKAEIERANAAAAQAGEMERLREKERVEQEAEIARQKALREEQLGSYAPPQYEPLERVAQREEMLQSIRDRHARQGGAASRRIVEANGVWGVAEIDASGELVFKPGKGQPPKGAEKTEMRVLQDEEGVRTPFMLDPADGSWYPMKVHPPGTVAPKTAPVGGGGGGEPAAPKAPSPQALHWRNLAAEALLKGGTEQEALQRLRAIGPQNGYSPEQILENAKTQARKRGWRG